MIQYKFQTDAEGAEEISRYLANSNEFILDGSRLIVSSGVHHLNPQFEIVIGDQTGSMSKDFNDLAKVVEKIRKSDIILSVSD